MKAKNLISRIIARRFSGAWGCGSHGTSPLVKGQFNIIMMCNGETEWNRKNRFCGWYDTKLSVKGRHQAVQAAKILKNTCFVKFDLAFTSVLNRAHETLEIILKDLNLPDISIVPSWRLNDRHYGALTGLDKCEVAAQYGDDQVEIWRQSYCIPPPAMKEAHRYYADIVFDPAYKCEPEFHEFPKFESLQLTEERTLWFWHREIVPAIYAGKAILIVAHGNCLRTIVKYLDKISDEDIRRVQIHPGIPFLYALHCKDEKLTPVPYGSLQFLSDPNMAKKYIESMESQGLLK